MFEETGLHGTPEKKPCGDDRWYVYKFKYNGEETIVLDDEHDQYDCVIVEEAKRRYQPKRVSEQIESFARRKRKQRDNNAVEDNLA